MNIDNVIYWFLLIGLAGSIARWWVDLVRFMHREIKAWFLATTILTNAADRKQIEKGWRTGTIDDALLVVLKRRGIEVDEEIVTYDTHTHTITLKRR